jgi:hypothetical protein
MVEELTAIRYLINSRGQSQIESKAETKKRLRRSPDRADMLAMLFDGSYEAWTVIGESPRHVESRYARMKEEMRVW